MADGLESALRQLLKSVMREVAADLIEEWKTPPRHQARQSTTSDEGFLLTPRETAKRLAISERHLFHITRSGSLPCVRVGKCVRYNAETVQKWVREAESTEQQSTTARDVTRKASEVPKPETPLSPRRTSKRVARRTQKGPGREKVPASERASLKALRPVSKVRPKEVQSEERISPFSTLLSELGIDKSSLPPMTNGDLRRIAEVDITTMHGWVYLNRSLPEDAMNRLRNHFRNFLKETQNGE